MAGAEMVIEVLVPGAIAISNLDTEFEPLKCCLS